MNLREISKYLFWGKIDLIDYFVGVIEMYEW